MDDLEGLDFDIKIQGQYQPVNQEWKQDTAPPVLQAEQAGEGILGYFATARNPVACMFHVLFKVGAVFSFLFLNAIINEEIISFVIIVLFAAFDFWTVQNITGRLLVNLRWRTEIDHYGHEKWIYESDDSKKTLQAAAQAGDEDAKNELLKLENTPGAKTDQRIFWSALYLTPLVWLGLILTQIISFHFFWMITSGICFTLSFTNAQGFYYCQREHKAKLTEYIQARGLNVFMGAAKSSGILGQVAQGITSFLPSMLRR